VTNVLHTKLFQHMPESPLPALCMLLCLFVGCRETPTIISGEVNIDGRPLKIGPNVRGTVVFQPTSHHGSILNGIIDRSGHFQLAVGSSKSIQPGVYVATVSAVEIEPAQNDNSLPGGRRITPAKYASSGTSGLRVEVKPGENHVILDLESEPADSGVEDRSAVAASAKTRSPRTFPSDTSSKPVIEELAPQERTE
jgi:hypothetical protein